MAQRTAVELDVVAAQGARTLPGVAGMGVSVHAEAPWVRASISRWGLCGVRATADDGVIGWLVVAPISHVPVNHPAALLIGHGHVRPAAVLLGAWIDDEWQGRRVDRTLVQHLAARLLGAPQPPTALLAASRPGGGVATPEAAWLESVGFCLVSTVLPTQLLRLDLSSTAQWRAGLDEALSRIQRLVRRPVAPPEPSTRVGREAVPPPRGRHGIPTAA